MGMKTVLLLAAMLAACSEARLFVPPPPPPPPPCYPVFDPRPDCATDQVPDWVYWSSMQYKYFAKALTKSQAEKFCVDWDEKVCEGEDKFSNFRAHLGSFISEGEVDLALLAAYKASCIKNGNLFWLGVNKVEKGKLRYSDRRLTSRNTFKEGLPKSLKEGTDCVAMDADDNGRMVIVPCDRELPFLCKIQPVSSH